MGNNHRQLDTTIEIVTPENIAFRYEIAGPFRRLPAYLIDLAIRIGVAMLFSFGVMLALGTAGLPDIGAGLMLLGWFVLTWFYGGLFETFWNGQTPGKRAMQIRVISIDGQPVTGLQAVLRNVLRAIDMQPYGFYVLGLLSSTMNDRFQRLGDLAAGTMVVHEERQWFRGLVRVTEPEALRLAALIPADFQASRSLARAVAAYVQRRDYFHRLRRLEIARHLGEPLRGRFGLPPGTDLDQLLVAVYHRAFVTDRMGELLVVGQSPFRAAGHGSDVPAASGFRSALPSAAEPVVTAKPPNLD
jgi:uncharacterized RDD family membrane protein YckC